MNIRKLSRIVGSTVIASLLVAGSVSAVSAASADEEPRIYTQAEADALWSQVEDYISTHSTDLAGIEAFTKALYDAPDMVVTVGNSRETMSGAEAQVVIDQEAEAQKARIESGSAARAVPIDAFEVSFSFIPRPNTGYLPYAAYGTWNFRDDYVNGSDPDDIATIRLEGVATGSCREIGGTASRTFLYNGTETGVSYLRDAGLGTGAPVVAIDDGASGFQMTADNGYVLTDIIGHCGPVTTRGVFTYEHNQDGGAVVTVSASFGGVGISYSEPQVPLQKSSQIATY